MYGASTYGGVAYASTGGAGVAPPILPVTPLAGIEAIFSGGATYSLKPTATARQLIIQVQEP